MAILGVAEISFGVDDVALCTRFWEDFGLAPLARDASQSVFEVASASKVTVRHRSDPRLPPPYFEWPGIRETIWGVDTAASLEQLVTDLLRDRKVERAADGTARFFADDGQPIGLRVWDKRPVLSQPDPVNAPGCIQRLNLHRKWRQRARPKTINHVVFFSKDYVASFEFYRDRLGLTRERIRQIQNEALLKLRRHMVRDGISKEALL